MAGVRGEGYSGDAAELAWLLSMQVAGYTVERAPRRRLAKGQDAQGTARWAAYGSDYFSLFDVVAIGPRAVLWTQVKGAKEKEGPSTVWRLACARMPGNPAVHYLHCWLGDARGPLWVVYQRSAASGLWMEYRWAHGEPDDRLLTVPPDARPLRAQ